MLCVPLQSSGYDPLFPLWSLVFSFQCDMIYRNRWWISGYPCNGHFRFKNVHDHHYFLPCRLFLKASMTRAWSPTSLFRSSISFWYSFPFDDSPSALLPPSRNLSFHPWNCAMDTPCAFCKALQCLLQWMIQWRSVPSAQQWTSLAF